MHKNIFMNPVRQRIIQYLIVHDKGTVGDIRKRLSDVPIATLYRHIKILLENDYLEVIEEKPVRGTIEKTYCLTKISLEQDVNEISYLVQSSLLSLMTSFQNYFIKEDCDPMKDMISLTSSTLMLSDEEFIEVSKEIGLILNKHLTNQPNKERKARNITMISSPSDDNRR
jgi:DNA-binding transcriptional ArsR family regulator